MTTKSTDKADSTPDDGLPPDALPDVDTSDVDTSDAGAAPAKPMAEGTNLSADDRLGFAEERLDRLEEVLLAGSVHESHHFRLHDSGYSGDEYAGTE